MSTLLLKPEQAAERLGISRSRVYKLISEGTLPSITIGKSRRVPADALRRWVKERQSEQAGVA
jgi:excisionase family DNA binding protein